MTLKKLAELAHVSPSTASKALANSREVSEETVRHVRQVARESGYLRQCKERRLSYRKPSAPTIAVICPEIISVYYSAIATCLSRLAESHGGTSAVYLSGFEPERQSALLEDLAVKPGVDAAVLIPGAAGALMREDFCIPVVQLGGTSYSPAFDCIDFDLEAGLLEAVRHLQGLGHRRIGYLGERLASPKEARVRAAMARAGLTAREEDFFIAAGRFEQAGYAAAKEALGRGDVKLHVVLIEDGDDLVIQILPRLGQTEPQLGQDILAVEQGGEFHGFRQAVYSVLIGHGDEQLGQEPLPHLRESLQPAEIHHGVAQGEFPNGGGVASPTSGARPEEMASSMALTLPAPSWPAGRMFRRMPMPVLGVKSSSAICLRSIPQSLPRPIHTSMVVCTS